MSFFSAGIGRTGAFIALDILVSQARLTGEVDVLACVETLRRQRVNMVQTAVSDNARLNKHQTNIKDIKVFVLLFVELYELMNY